MSCLFERVAVVGAGLIGGSLGLAMRRRGLAGCVVGVGHRQVSIDRALEMGAIDEGTLDVLEGVRGADLVVLATGINLIVEMGKRIAPHLAPGTIVTDVGSTKTVIVAAMTGALPEGVHFVGAHPIAGSEKRGVAAAEADLFEDAACVLTPTGDTSEAAVRKVSDLWQAVGARVTTLSPEVHDAVLARISHLPHVTAAVLVATLSAGDDALTGTGYRDTTRVASGDVNLWCDILLSNRPAVLDAADRFAVNMADLMRALESGDRDRLAAMLAVAKGRRDALSPDAGERQ